MTCWLAMTISVETLSRQEISSMYCIISRPTSRILMKFGGMYFIQYREMVLSAIEMCIRRTVDLDTLYHVLRCLRLPVRNDDPIFTLHEKRKYMYEYDRCIPRQRCSWDLRGGTCTRTTSLSKRQSNHAIVW